MKHGGIFGLLIMCSIFFIPLFAIAVMNDLGLVSITFSKDEFIAGDRVRMYATVRNYGQEDVIAYVTFWRGSIPIGNSQLVSVRADGLPDEVFIDFEVPDESFNIRAVLQGDAPGDEVLSNDEVLTPIFVPLPDGDRDGITDRDDNCPSVSNVDQDNHDSDTSGDACDPDDDNDGVSDTNETVQGTNPFVKDSDGDGVDDLTDVYPLDPLLTKKPIIVAPVIEEEPIPPDVVAQEELSDEEVVMAELYQEDVSQELDSFLSEDLGGTSQQVFENMSDEEQVLVRGLLVGQRIIPEQMSGEERVAFDQLSDEEHVAFAEVAVRFVPKALVREPVVVSFEVPESVEQPLPFWRLKNPIVGWVVGILTVGAVFFLALERRVRQKYEGFLVDEKIENSAVPKKPVVVKKKPVVKKKVVAKKTVPVSAVAAAEPVVSTPAPGVKKVVISKKPAARKKAAVKKVVELIPLVSGEKIVPASIVKKTVKKK